MSALLCSYPTHTNVCGNLSPQICSHLAVFVKGRRRVLQMHIFSDWWMDEGKYFDRWATKNIFLWNLPTAEDGHSWRRSHGCDSCSLILRKNSIHCLMDGLFIIYAQVTFSKHPEKNPNKSVILRKNASYGTGERPLVEGNIPNTVEGSVWVAKIVSLKNRDSVRLDITGDFLKGSTSTFWGAYELH